MDEGTKPFALQWYPSQADLRYRTEILCVFSFNSATNHVHLKSQVSGKQHTAPNHVLCLGIQRNMMPCYVTKAWQKL
jgi:hypothetical protein